MKKEVPLFYDTKTHLTFDDVCLVGGLGTVTSRSKVDLTSELPKGYSLGLPVMTAAMDTITSPDMANAIINHGGAVIHHRNQDIDSRVRELKAQKDHAKVVGKSAINGVAIGLSDADYVRELIEAGANLICIELAHSYHENVAELVNQVGPICRDEGVLLMVGNFSGVEAAKWLYQETGDLVDIVKVSQGGGSCCTTRLVTGIGKPTWQAVADLTSWEDLPYCVVADGGIKTSGDLAKALGAGACAGMLGGMLSGTNETPGEVIEQDGRKYKAFRGMASAKAKERGDGVIGHSATKNVEGISTLVPYRGSVVDVFNQIRDGVQSSVASCGFEALSEFQKEVQFIRVSGSNRYESVPHAVNLKGE